MAGLQASSKFPGAPATLLDALAPTPRKDPAAHIPGFRLRKTGTHELHAFTHFHSDTHTHASEHLQTQTLESSRGPGSPTATQT